MKIVGMVCTLAVVLGLSGAEPKVQEVGISVFAQAVYAVAKENKVTLGEAAGMLRKLGVTGFDASYDSSRIPELIAVGMKPVNLYGKVDFLKPETVAETTERFLAAAEKYGVGLVMVLPPRFSGPKADTDAEAEKMLPGFRSFAIAARKRGIVPTIEDFGYADNVCSYSVYIRKILSSTPELDFTPDSGNLYCIAREQEDIVPLTAAFRDRIRHVHLKDFARSYVPGAPEEVYETLGLGAVDNRGLVEVIKSVNYRGWYTLENPVGNDTLADVARQVATLRLWLERSR